MALGGVRNQAPLRRDILQRGGAMARKTVKARVREIRKAHPSARVDVLYTQGGGWDGVNSKQALPESEWAEYRVLGEMWYGDALCVVDAS